MHRRSTRQMTIARILAFWSLMGVLPAPRAMAQQIWFSPLEHGVATVKGDMHGSLDYMDMFEPSAPWAAAARSVNVFVLGARYAAFGPETDLKRVIAGLRDRGIALAVGIGALSGSERCGHHVEGYSAPGEPISIAMRMKRLGADLQYIGMDEPLFFGHFFNGPDACHASIDAIANDVAAKVRDVRRIFPNIKIGQAEPVTSYPGDDWAAAISEWLSAYERAVGRPLDFFHLDLAWHLAWQDRVRRVQPLLKKAGVPLGIIFNGDGNSPTDKAWLDLAASRYMAYEQTLGVPEQVIFSSWMAHPSHVLPESDPSAFASLIVRYNQWKGQLGR